MSYVILTDLHSTSPAARETAIANAASFLEVAPIDRATDDDWGDLDRLEAAGLSWETSGDGNELLIHDGSLDWACNDCAYDVEYGVPSDSDPFYTDWSLANAWEVIYFPVELIGYCSICERCADYAPVPGGYPIIPRD